jgi:large repetitive protein
MTGRRRSILALGLLASCVSPLSSAISSEIVNYTYDARGRLVKTARSGTVNNGVNACNSYDKADNRSNVNVTIATACDVPPLPSFAVSDVTVTEGGAIVFTVTKTGSTSSTITLNYATADGGAVVGSDYTTKSGTLSFAPTDTSKTVSVPTTNDSAIESPETLYLNLSNVSSGGAIADGQGIGTIQDNEGFSVSNPTPVTEAQAIQFTITKTGTTSNDITLAYATSDGTATANSDYSPKAGSIKFLVADTSKMVQLTALSDTTIEANETVLLNIFNASFGTIVDGQGVGTINDDDTPPSFSVNDASVTEGGSVVFTVTKTGLTQNSYGINFATSDGTAIAGSDYTTVSGTLTFAATDTSKTWSVPTTGDLVDENNEQFNFTLSGATGGATITDATGVGTINDDDPSFAISDASGNENGSLTFTVTKTGSGAANLNYATADGTATSASDYNTASGTLTFITTDTSKQITVTTKNDATSEIDETFNVNLSNPTNGAVITDSQGVGTIRDDDGGTTCSGVSYAVTNNPADDEGNPLSFTISKTGSTSNTCTVHYATADGTAVAPGDYTALPDTVLSFLVGETLKTVTVTTTTTGGLNEPDETMYLNLSSPSGGATISDSQGVGTLHNLCSTCLLSAGPSDGASSADPNSDSTEPAPDPAAPPPS